MGVWNPVMLILYGTAVMAIILDVRPGELSRQKQVFWVLCTAGVIAVSAVFMLTIGQPAYGKVYFLLVQLPLLLEFSVLSPYRGVKVLFALLSTIIFAAPPIMLISALRTFYGIGPVATALVYFFGYAAMVLVTYFFLKNDFNYMIKNCGSAQFWVLCMIPVLHYVYSFTKTKYDFTQVRQMEGFWYSRLPTVITVLSYVLLVWIFRSVRENQEMRSKADLIHTQMEAAELRLQELNRTQEQTRRYRHDMRHHFTFLQGLAAEGDVARITEYLHTAQSDLDAFTPARYCENETANLILSSFAAKAKQAGVELDVNATLPEALPISETELCSLLSNSLENAVKATSEMLQDEKKTVTLRATVYHENLLLSVENPYAGKVILEHNLPVSDLEGHGYGTRNIVAIAETYGGQVLFTAQDGVFTIKIMLPLSKREEIVR